MRPRVVRGLNILLIVVAGALYVNTLGHDYALDDYGVILESDYTTSGLSGITRILSTGYRTSATATDNQLYRPLSKVMFAVEWSIAPNSPGLSHSINVVLFALTVVLLFNVLRLYIANSVLVPFLAAVLFAVHPIHTEVVANIKGRDDILCFLFFVVTALYVFRFTHSKSLTHLALLSICFFLSLLSKESAVAFLAVIPLMLYVFTNAGKDVYVKAMSALAGVTVLFLVIRTAVLTGPVPRVPVVDNYIAGIDGFLTQRTTAISIAGLYLWKLIVPHPLVCDMSVSQLPIVGPGDWRFLVSFAIYAAAAVFAITNVRSKSIVSFSILYFVLTLFMVSNVPFILGTNYGERLLYAPSFGICLAMAYALARFLQNEERAPSSVGNFMAANMKAVAVVAVLAVVYGWLTVNRNAEWKDSLTLYSADVQKAPNSAKLHYFYANHIAQPDYVAQFPAGSPERKKVIDTAAGELEKALALYPPYTDATHKRAEMFLEQGNPDSADLYYRRAIQLSPSNATFRNNYGRMLFNEGRLDEAQLQFEAALRFSPAFARALNNLAGVYGTRGANWMNQAGSDTAHGDELRAKATQSYLKSLEYSLKAVQDDPDYAQAYETCAITYGSLGDRANQQKYMQLAQLAKQRTGKPRTQRR